jgi:amino acid permease
MEQTVQCPDKGHVLGKEKQTRWEKAGMTKAQWKEAVKFDSTDWGWVIMSIGMAIGAGIVFLPVQVGLAGIWIYLLSSIIGYPAMYLFQRLFINTLAKSERCEDYPSVIGNYLGKNWGLFLGLLYFLMLIIWVFVYSTAINNDSASFLVTFGVTDHSLAKNPLYGLAIICALVAIASRGEKVLFKISTLTIIMLPFTLTSILFLQSLSPMVISYRSHNKSIEVARYKALRAMNIAFGVLFVTVFFYAISFNLAMGHDQAVMAYENNISALALAAQGIPGTSIKIMSLILNIFAVVTAFFGVFLGFREACRGIAMNCLKRIMPEDKINVRAVSLGILVFAVLVSWGAIILNAPVLSFTSICSPVFGMIGCLIPAYLVYRVPRLHDLKGVSLYLIIATGILLIISPFLAFS